MSTKVSQSIERPLQAKSRRRWLPFLLTMFGLCLTGYFSYDYLMQTLLIHEHRLPQYRTHPTMWKPAPTVGEQIGTIRIPSIGLDDPIVEGTDSVELKEGVGHYGTSPLPGEPGNVVLAGHRDTVFAPLQNIHVRDQIAIDTPYGSFHYAVVSFQVVRKDNISVLKSSASHNLTLITCYPFFYFGFAPDRYIIFAKQIRAKLGTPANQ